MSFDCIVVKKVVQELQDIEGYKISKIYQIDKNTVILGLYGALGNLALISCIGNNYRINLTTKNYKNPLKALNFSMLLRKHILGYKIKKIYCEDFERIVYIDLENFEIPEKPILKTLVIELMGKHSNIILLNSDGIIIDSLRHFSSEENANRDIYPTARYIKPKTTNYFDYILENDKTISRKDLENKVNKILGAKNVGIKITKYKNYIPKSFELSLDYDTKKYPIFPLNYSLDDFYYDKENLEIFKNYRNTVLKFILGILKKYEKRLKNIDDKLAECENMDKYKIYGELITANLYKYNNENLSFIEVENYYDNNNLVKIDLDKRFSLSVNAKKYFKKYNKLKNAKLVVFQQKQDTIRDIEYIESIVFELENCNNISEVQDIYSEISENSIFFPNKKVSQPKKIKRKNKEKNLTKNKYAKFNPIKIAVDGFTILIGRNNKENDYLTNKFAKKSDIWFHTKDVHGSHVVIRTNPGEIVPDNVLYEAAKCAVLHSKAKDSSNVPVDYCEIRFVKKVPGNHPGLVTYSNNKTIYVN